MGALDGVRVVELAGIGPGPFCGMMLADMGAEIIRIDRAGSVRGGDPASPPAVVNARGRRSIGVDLKSEAGRDLVLRLVEDADVVFEGFRPGVAERLGVGPEDCLARNPAIVYGRMTGWGQDGPYASTAGHDINYISLAGALAHMGRSDSGPVPPLNLVGDFGGGGMYLAFGMVCALVEARTSGMGQVVDAAMVDGAASLMGFFHGMLETGLHVPGRGRNMLDTGAHFYDVYETSDGRHMSVGALEPQFFAELVRLLDLGDRCPGQMEFDRFDEMRALFAETFKQRTQAEWVALFEGTDACVAGVIPMSEAKDHPHMAAREVFVEKDGVVQPQPAPRFSRTPATLGLPPSAKAGIHTRDALAAWGIEDVDGLIERGAAVQA